MDFPIIDKRNAEDIYNELIQLAKRYVPEWRPDSEGGEAGAMLSRVFSEMFAETIKRFNVMPYKNYLFFLNLLGADTFNAISAKGYATVKLNPGEYEGVPIRKGTRVYSFSDDGQRIIYEFTDSLFAVNNKVLEIFCKNTDGSVIVKPYDVLENGEMDLCPEFSLFNYKNYKNLQNYLLILSGGEGLNVPPGAVVTLHFFNSAHPPRGNKTVEILKNPEMAKWFTITIEDSTDGTGGMSVRHEIPEVATVGNKLSFPLGVPVDETEYSGYKERRLCCQMLFAPSAQPLDFTEIKISSAARNILPDKLYNNDIPLTQTDFQPFGDRFSEFDDFCFCANQVFNQAGAKISIDFVMRPDMIKHEPGNEGHKIKWRPIMSESEVKTPPPNVICIERVLWEYWNGHGWARLFPDNRYEDIFKLAEPVSLSLKFICPRDFAESFQGAAVGRWIRARILSVNDLYGANTLYQVPVIEKMRISYDLGQDISDLESVYIEKDLETIPLHVYGQTLNEAPFPVTYISFEKALTGGPFKLYFKKADVYGRNKNVNTIQYEYYGYSGGIRKWIEIKPLDETDYFTHSGLITFIIKQPMEKLTLYGRERYWIRLINTDGGYEDESGEPPVFLGLHLNTCGIYQQESMRMEYFAIEPQEANKLCVLENRNITELNVLINEKREILTNEPPASGPGDTVVERNEAGEITDYWVRWREVDKLEDAGASDRVYVLDKKKGHVFFGNGKHGKIPPYTAGAPIKIEYRVTMGGKGNLMPFKLEGFADSVPFVDKVYNIEPLVGGFDIEKDGEAVKRLSKMAAIQDRAVSQYDFAVLAKSADRNIWQVKIVNRDGRLVIIVLPHIIPGIERSRRSPEYFEEIKRSIQKMLFDKGPATLWGKMIIQEARYILFKIMVDVTVLHYNDYHEVNRDIEKRLTAFLDPITGGSSAGGFEIGQMPTKTKIYMLLKSIPKILKINSLNICCYEMVQGKMKETDYDKVVLMEDAVPVSGNHDITIGVLMYSELN